MSGVMICGVTPVVKRFHPSYIKCRAHLKYRCGLINACVIEAGIRAASAISAESKGLPRDAGTTAKGVRCGKPFSMNEMLERRGEKALSPSGQSTGWLMQPKDGGCYNPMYRMPWWSF